MTQTDLKTLLSASYKSQREAQEMLKPYGYSYDPALSTVTDKVFLDKEGNPTVLHRGSKRIVQDWLSSNLPLAVGLEGKASRFKHGKELISELRQKYPSKQITSVGHSLGGAIAEKSGADRVLTYNKGAGLGDIGRSIKPTQTDIRTRYDLPSLLSTTQTGGKKIELPGTLHPVETHSISGGLPDKILFA